MDHEQDRKYEIQAIEKLDNYLIDCEWTEREKYISKEDLLTIYSRSKSIIQQNHENTMLQQVADSVFETCVRLVRCIVLEEPKAMEIIIKGKVQYIEGLSQTDNLKRNYIHMQQLEKQC